MATTMPSPTICAVSPRPSPAAARRFSAISSASGCLACRNRDERAAGIAPRRGPEPGNESLRMDLTPNDEQTVFQTATADWCRDNMPLERSEEHTSELQSLMRISYAVFCLKNKNTIQEQKATTQNTTNTN